jgi:hypothetical protein
MQWPTYYEATSCHHFQTVIGLSDDVPILNAIFYADAAGESCA